MKEPIYTWDKENYVATCEIEMNGEENIVTHAYCHPDDKDMGNEWTGYEIAQRRAVIKILKRQRDKIKEQLKGLNKVYYSIKHSKKFNSKSYESRMLIHHIDIAKKDLILLKSAIKEKEKDLRTYMEDKNKFYIALRKLRKSKAKDN